MKEYNLFIKYLYLIYTAQVVNAALAAPINAYSPSPALPPPSSSPAIQQQQQQPPVALPQPAQHVQLNQESQIGKHTASQYPTSFNILFNWQFFSHCFILNFICIALSFLVNQTAFYLLAARIFLLFGKRWIGRKSPPTLRWKEIFYDWN